jgi:hypothetical protein
MLRTLHANGAPVFFIRVYIRNWCARGGRIAWPPISPDLIATRFLCVYAQRPQDIYDLEFHVNHAGDVKPHMAGIGHRYELCRGSNGGHVEA